jgi:glycosyltransferase involved in cell wall biosynthesis
VTADGMRDVIVSTGKRIADAVRFPIIHRPAIARLAPVAGKHNILLVTLAFEPGGGELVALNIARHTDRERFAFHALATDRSPHRWRERFQDAFENTIVPDKWRLSPQGYERYLACLIETQQIELLLFYHNKPTFAILPRLARRFPRLRFVDIAHYVYPEDWFRDTIPSIPHLHARVAISQSIAADLRRLYAQHGLEAHADKIHCIYNGIEEPELSGDGATLRERLGVGKNTRLVSYVGRFDPVKQPRRFVEVAEKLAEMEDVAFVMAGDGEEMPAVRDAAASAGLGERLVLAGMLNPDDARQLIAESSLLMITSDSEGIPMVALEAMMLGTPIVTTRCGGIDEAVKDGETGRVVELGEGAADRLAAAAREVLASPELADAYRQAARSLARQQFSAPAMGARYAELFGELLEG